MQNNINKIKCHKSPSHNTCKAKITVSVLSEGRDICNILDLVTTH